MLGFLNIPLSLLAFLICKSNLFCSLRSFGSIPTIKIANQFVFMDNNSFKEDSTARNHLTEQKVSSYYKFLSINMLWLQLFIYINVEHEVSSETVQTVIYGTRFTTVCGLRSPLALTVSG